MPVKKHILANREHCKDKTCKRKGKKRRENNPRSRDWISSDEETP